MSLLCQAAGCRTEIPSHIPYSDIPKCEDCGAVLCKSCVGKGAKICGRCELDLLKEKVGILSGIIFGESPPEVAFFEHTTDQTEQPTLPEQTKKSSPYVNALGEVDLDRLVGDSDHLLRMLAGCFHRTLDLEDGAEVSNERIKIALGRLKEIEDEYLNDGTGNGLGVLITALTLKLLQMLSDGDEPTLFA